MSRIARMRAKQGLPIPTPKPVSPPEPKPAKPAKQAKPPGEQITHSCKHTTDRARLEAQPCPACRQAANQERSRKKLAKRLEKKAAKHELDSQGREERGRLPHGSEFIGVRYWADTQTWSGALSVPGCPNPFTGTASNVEKLLRSLAEQYRAWARGAKEVSS